MDIPKDKAGKRQSMDYKEYLALKEKQGKKKPFNMPLPLKIILMTPLVIIFCLGVFFIPYIIFLIIKGMLAGGAK